jgi:hypothetical protein
LKAIPQWIQSGILDQVSQIGIELHTHSIVSKDRELSDLVGVLRSLHQIGFRLISTSNNECVGTTADPEHKFYSLMEVVFYKEN